MKKRFDSYRRISQRWKTKGVTISVFVESLLTILFCLYCIAPESAIAESEYNIAAIVNVQDVLNLREKPEWNAEVVKKLTRGTKVTVLERPEEKKPWVQIQVIETGYKGWVHGGFLTYGDGNESNSYREIKSQHVTEMKSNDADEVDAIENLIKSLKNKNTYPPISPEITLKALNTPNLIKEMERIEKILDKGPVVKDYFMCFVPNAETFLETLKRQGCSEDVMNFIKNNPKQSIRFARYAVCIFRLIAPPYSD